MNGPTARVLCLLLVLFGVLSAGARAEPIAPADIRVIDGDTIVVRAGEVHVRLVGFDAPELSHPRCESEEARAKEATRRLDGMIREGGLDLSLIQCACAPGTEGTRACNYGRRCGTLLSRGRDVGAVLIAEGLAVPYTCGPTRCPTRTHSWCPR